MSERLLQFAGDDRPARPKTDRTNKPSAYSLFQLGHDTAEIAAIRGEQESKVLLDLTMQRCKARSLPSPYEARR